jgi:uncharacterized protein YdeI (YjbR/CyaY-like superfamily)
MPLNPKVNTYIAQGCGRCSLVGTPKCKVIKWQVELEHLRQFMLDSGLTEDVKWHVPCYTYQSKNVVMLHAFKEYSFLSFIKGTLLTDTENLLVAPSENTQGIRQLRFTSTEEITKIGPQIKAFLKEALELEKAGKKVVLKKTSEYVIPDELQIKLEENEALKNAFFGLTPGRQRGYLLYFSAPKQAKTKEARVEKYIPQILAGKGLED